jgi:wobble nucleotide-excising tRNase
MPSHISRLRELIDALDEAPAGSSEDTDAHIRELVLVSKNLVDEIRNKFQHQTAEQAEELCSKLKANSRLSHEELKLLEHYMVGSAKSYLAEEARNFDGWLRDLDQYVSQMEQQLLTEPMDNPEQLIDLMGKAKIALRLTRDLSFYGEEKHRLERYEHALSDGIDSQEAETYAGILELQLNNPHL